MEILKRLFGGQRKHSEIKMTHHPQEDELEWEPLAGFVPACDTDKTLVSIIAAAIAARDYPESKFKVLRVLQRNPEAVRVSIIAAAVAAEVSENSQLVVKKIHYKK